MIIDTIVGPTSNNKQNLTKLIIQCDNCNNKRVIPARYRNKERRTKYCPKCADLLIGRPFTRNGLDYYLNLLGPGYEVMYFIDRDSGNIPCAQSKVMLLCPAGHFWKTSLIDIDEKGNRCPYCSGRAPKTEMEYHKFAMIHNIKFVGPYPKGVAYKTRWLCSCGNEFISAYNWFYNKKKVACDECLIRYYSEHPDLQDEYRKFGKSLDWSKTIYGMFDFKCQKCFEIPTKDKQIQAHHIFNWKDFPDLRYEVKNGIALCKYHHCEFHTRFGKKKNTLTQIELYLGRELNQEQRKFLKLKEELLLGPEREI